jgi:hypothetical protein
LFVDSHCDCPVENDKTLFGIYQIGLF